MLTNYITTADLEAVYADLLSYRRGGQIDFTGKIALAYKQMCDDFQMRGKNIRKMMVPVDLNRDASTSPLYQFLITTIASASGNGYGWEESTGRFGRLVVDVSARGTDTAWTIKVQGSNETARPADDSPYWVDAAVLVIPVDDTGGSRNIVFSNRFKWYRRVVTLTDGAGSLSFTAVIEETTFDALIVNKAIELIAGEINSGQSPMWPDRRDVARVNYDTAMKSIQFTVDENEDGYPDETETTQGGTELWR
jgi:hypothetical protein